VNPFATIPAFLAMTAGQDSRVRPRMARRAAWTCFFILSLFAFCGSLVFQMFGITLASCQIAGGLIMLLIGLEMLQARRSPTQEHTSETLEGAAKEDIGITPLGVPMLAGPGAISAVIVLTEDPPRWVHMSVVFLVIVITSVAAYLILVGAERIGRRLGDTGIRIMMRMMGLLLTAIAVQFVVNGLARLGVVIQSGGG
jgi:multiple antibiotic resistance protein